MAIGDVIQAGSANLTATSGTSWSGILGSAPTEDNTLVIFVGTRDETQTPAPDDSTQVGTWVDSISSPSGQQYRLGAFIKIVPAAATTTLTLTGAGAGGAGVRMQYVELEGTLALDSSGSISDGDLYGSSPDVMSMAETDVAVSATAIALVGSMVARLNVSDPFSPTAVAPASDMAIDSGDQRVPMWTGYRNINPAAGSYNMAADVTYGGDLNGHVAILVAFNIEEEDPDPPDPDPEPEPPPDPEPGIWIDFDENGFDDGTATLDDGSLARRMPQSVTGSGLSDNVTEWVLGSSRAITGQRPGSADHITQPSPESYTFYLKNSDGRWNPDNTASPVYPKFRPGLPVWGGMNADGTLSGTGQTVYGFMAGYIRSIAPVPSAGPTYAPVVEVIVDGPMAHWRRRRAQVEFQEGRTYADYREAILSAIGEPTARRNLGYEADVLAFSGNATNKRDRIAPVSGSRDTFTHTVIPDFRLPETRTDPVALLESLNLATGARHFIQPADTKEDWYYYTTVPRQHKMDAAVDATWNGDDIVQIAGYEVSDDSILNVQEVTFSQVTATSTPVTVWEYGDVPFALTGAANKVIIAELGDFVTDATLDVASSGSTVTSTLTSYGTGAVIRLGSAGTSQVTSLRISGNRISRDSSQTIEKRATGVTPAKERLAPTISTDYLQSQGLAEGRAAFTPYKFSRQLSRPSAKFIRDFSIVLPRQLYDVIALTVDQLSVTAKRHEITGISFSVSTAASAAVSDWSFTFDLQETPNQTALDLWVWDTSLWSGTDVWAP